MAYRNKVMVSQNLYHVFLACVAGLVVWVLYSAYQVAIVPIKVTVEKKVLEPITVSLDEPTIDLLMTHEFVSPDVSQLPSSTTPAPESIIQVATESSPSGQATTQ